VLPRGDSRAYGRVMARLNLTLDEDTFRRLDRHARETRSRRSTVAKILIQEALDRREAAPRRRKLALDYAAERESTRELLRDLDAAQLEPVD
jgi:hypothetical protein